MIGLKRILTAALALAACPAIAQSPAFEVASVRPVAATYLQDQLRAGQKPNIGVKITASQVTMGFQSLTELIAWAYGVSPLHISGPDFLENQYFEIAAKMPEGATEAQAPSMLQALLADRFKMTMHRDKKEVPVYALVVGKSGLKMTKAEAEAVLPEPQKGDITSDTPFGKMTGRMDPGKGMVMFGPGVGTMRSSMGPNGIRIEITHLTMARLIPLLEETSDRPVVDETGLTGSWHAVTEISMDMADPGPREGATAPEPGGLNPMLKSVEQMGLKLEPRKEMVDMIVIDHIEKTPTAN